MFNAPRTPKAKTRSAPIRLFSRLLFPFLSRSQEETPEIACRDTNLHDLYLAAGIRPPTPLLKSSARFDGLTPELLATAAAGIPRPDPVPGFGRAEKNYDAPRGVGLGLDNSVRQPSACPVKPVGWKAWPVLEASHEDSDPIDDEICALIDYVNDDAARKSDDESSDEEEHEEEWSLENVSWENMELAIRATRRAQRKRVVAGLRAHAYGSA